MRSDERQREVDASCPAFEGQAVSARKEQRGNGKEERASLEDKGFKTEGSAGDDGNISIETAFNRRDVADIDRQYAEIEAERRREEEILLENFQNDDLDGPMEFEDFGDHDFVPSAAATPKELEARIKRMLEAKAEKGLPKRIKLPTKSAPQPTSYIDGALVSKAEVKRLRSIEAEAKAKKQKVATKAMAKAKAALINQPELAHAEGHEVGAAVQDFEAPHVTHDMKHMACVEAAVIFCDRCGNWSRRNAHTKLAEPCSGVCGWRGGLTLLRHGIMPVQGARLPPGLRRR